MLRILTERDENAEFLVQWRYADVVEEADGLAVTKCIVRYLICQRF